MLRGHLLEKSGLARRRESHQAEYVVNPPYSIGLRYNDRFFQNTRHVSLVEFPSKIRLTPVLAQALTPHVIDARFLPPRDTVQTGRLMMPFSDPVCCRNLRSRTPTDKISVNMDCHATSSQNGIAYDGVSLMSRKVAMGGRFTKQAHATYETVSITPRKI